MTARRWSVLLGALIGLVVGIGGYTFVYARGHSYLGNDPTACANCHVMHEQYNAWLQSSHRSVATCNDCHTPHDFLGKYYTKASNGFWHSFYFTFGFHDPIRITPTNRRVTEAACRSCHEPIVEAMEHGAGASNQPISCIGCHGSVGHPEGHGTPYLVSRRAP